MTTVEMRHQGASRAAAWFAILIVMAGFSPGCKSGSSWTSKPSWWSFGGSTPDAAKLADAPPAGDVTKPSASATPYPTTSTPEGYSLAEAQRVEQTTAALPAAPAAAAPQATAITYGTTPTTPPAIPGTLPPAASAAQPGGLSSIAPQVGPYGSPAANTAALTATPASGSTPAFAPVQPPPATPLPTSDPATGVAAAAVPQALPAEQRFGSPTARVADARSAPGWQSPAEPAAPAGGSRYDAANGSRFSGGLTAQPAVPAADPFATQPAASALPQAVPFPAAPPAAMPAIVPPPAAAPAGMPPAAAPPVPTRRADPGYRPGGTSSYRPSRAILAEGTDTVDEAVRPASFQTELPAAP